MDKKAFTTRDIALIGVLSAMVFAATYLHIDIPTALGKTMIHLGNVVCLLGGLLFGPLTGGLSAGIGSALYDLIDPAYASEAWITFINKFMMGMVAGLVFRIGMGKGLKKENLFTVIAGICGAVTYVTLYVSKTIIIQYFINSGVWATVYAVAIQKGTISLINGLIAVCVSSVLAIALRPALKKAHIFRDI
ncbi:MAG: ECF transporter S component [Clostridiaceae bacterium]|nr:ECF transporter S component [Clostridiaceae bacterium]